MRFTAVRSTCSPSAASESTNAKPAASNVASWRVRTAISVAATRSPQSGRPAAGRVAVTATSTGNTPERLSFCRASLGLSASMTPDTVRPSGVNAVYSKTGMGRKVGQGESSKGVRGVYSSPERSRTAHS
jgi:hypothetical protein